MRRTRGPARAQGAACAVFVLAVTGSGHCETTPTATHALRQPTVADSIGMTQIGPMTEDEVVEWSSPVRFSPDGNNFVAVTHRGNLQKNTNDYSLLLFRTSDAFRVPQPELLLTAATKSSLLPGISNPRWLADGRTLLFLATLAGKRQQIYSIDIASPHLKALTHHLTDILGFDATGDYGTLVYLARQSVSNTALLDETSRQRGVAVTNQRLVDLLSNQSSVNWTAHPLELFIKHAGEKPTHLAFRNPEMPFPGVGVSISGDGRFAVIASLVRSYAKNELGSDLCGPLYWDNRYLLIDTRLKTVRPLLNAPSNFAGSVLWSPDGRSVVVGGSCLPLDTEDPVERELRKKTQWAVEVEAESGAFKKIAEGNYRVSRWNRGSNTVFLRRLNDTGYGFGVDNRLLSFRKEGGDWRILDVRSLPAVDGNSLDVQLAQSMNSPPRLVVVDVRNEREAVLMDLNPEFENIRFGHVEEIEWRSTDDEEVRGGLYLPPDYLPGQRYPLVMQSSGWNADEFWIDGPATSGFAAQALAGKGIVVADLPSSKQTEAGREGKAETAIREGLIDALDKRGLIDRSRVGVMGWSRAGYGVRHALAFSRYPIAAAVIADGMDGGYWQYIAEVNVHPGARNIYETQNGAAPFGGGLLEWIKNVASFNLEKVHTPIRLLGFGRYWFYYNWEQFAGLTRLAKPVEMIWLPDAAHELVRPLERLTAQEGDVDWFRFWLQDYEDPDHAKAEQYARWRKLREMQNANEAARATVH